VKAFSSDRFVIPLPPGHTFPIQKYALLRQAVLDQHIIDHRDLIEPPPARISDLIRVHDPTYVEDVLQGRLTESALRRLGLPWSPQLVERSLRTVGATIAAARVALSEGIAASLAGGTHHAFPGHGSGYCVFNDVAVAAETLIAEGHLRSIAIIDLDVHQGDGTALIFRNSSAVFTLSIHGARNYPLIKQISDLDIALPDHTSDPVYLLSLGIALDLLFQNRAPDLIFYLAGVDPLDQDRLGRINITPNGLRTRDEMVIHSCRARRIPLTIVMAGGYAHHISDTVAMHVQTLSLASDAQKRWHQP
jgi:acetoin utilization deacetylase AcuC-like enzyme